MPIIFTLKQDWRTYRGKLYHAGTVFTKVKHNEFPIDPNNTGVWYEFKVPKSVPLPYVFGSFGYVYVSKFVTI